MKKYFDPEKVMTSLRKLATLLDEPTENNAALADQFFETIRAIKTGRSREFSRQQLWELNQMESHLQQKLARSEQREGGQS